MLGDLTHSHCPVIGHLNPGWSSAQNFVTISVFILFTVQINCCLFYTVSWCSPFESNSLFSDWLPARTEARSARVRGIAYDIAQIQE